MPVYAWIQHNFSCPACGRDLPELSEHPAAFQWGYCEHRYPGAATPYHVGDQIIWRQSADRTTPAWTYFSSKGGNLGDPTIEDVIVTDGGTEWLIAGRHCPHCHAEFGGVTVEINGGVIQRAWIFASDEIYAEASTHLVMEDGAIQPLPEWDEHGMGFRKE